MHPVIGRFGKSVVIVDGGMGTLLQANGLMGGELPELWNLTHPEVLLKIQSDYVNAGCDILTANMFGANRLRLKPSIRVDNADGSTGPHWTMEQTTAVAESMGIQAAVVPRWAWGVTMNMMYSDYYPVAVEFGLNRPEFYAALAKAFLIDKDGPGPVRKLMKYYEHVVK